MKHTVKKHLKMNVLAALFVVTAFLLCSCGGSDVNEEPDKYVPKETAAESAAGTQVAAAAVARSSPAGSTGGSWTPEFRNSVFDSSAAEGNDEVQVDMSSVNEGYVAIHCQPTDTKIKFQVIKDDNTITYSVVTGKDQIFPLQSGDGHYIFRVMKNITDKKYAELYKCEAQVAIGDPFDPFLRPNQYTDYTENSECVQFAGTLAEGSASKAEFIASVYEYIAGSVTYDQEKAATVKSGYLPVPDDTLTTKKGICFDYASLAAAMLRSQGIPTQIIFGYVSPNDVYHAWNKFYTEEGGWQLVEFSVTGGAWNRIDLTFHAGGAGSEFIGDGSNYLEANVF